MLMASVERLQFLCFDHIGAALYMVKDFSYLDGLWKKGFVTSKTVFVL